MRNRQALTRFERSLLKGYQPKKEVLDQAKPGFKERYFGLISLNIGEDIAAAQYFFRSCTLFGEKTLNHAISKRLYGLTLIKTLREVEGTFALERANKVLIEFGYDLFDIE